MTPLLYVELYMPLHQSLHFLNEIADYEKNNGKDEKKVKYMSQVVINLGRE